MTEAARRRRKHRKKSSSLARAVKWVELKQLLSFLKKNRWLRFVVTLLLSLLGIAFSYYYIAPRIDAG